MFNPFRDTNKVSKTNNEELPNNSLETTEKSIDRRKIGADIKRLLSLSTVALAHLFTPQVAAAKDSHQEISTHSINATIAHESTTEAQAYQAMLNEVLILQKGIFADPVVVKAIEDIVADAPTIDNDSGEVSYFDTGDGSAFNKDPFVGMQPLNLTLKSFRDPGNFRTAQLKTKIDTLSAKLSSKQYEESFLKLQDELRALEPVFRSRPSYSIDTITNNLIHDGGIMENKKFAGWGSLRKKKTVSKINTGLQYGTTDAVGNKEIYVVMKALEPLGHELGKRFSSVVGCDVQSVKASTKLLSSVHVDPNGQVSKTPYNNVHPVFSLEVCQKNYTPITGTPIKTTPFISIFNNSNGYGAPDLNRARSTDEGSMYIAEGHNPKVDKKWSTTTEQLIPDTNRLIITAGVKIDIPIPNTYINFVPKLGLQYGYTVDGKKLSPVASFSFVYTKEGSPLNGLEVGLLPVGKKQGNSPNVVYFSTKYSMTF